MQHPLFDKGILSLIFQFFRHDQVSRLGRVCQRWRQVVVFFFKGKTLSLSSHFRLDAVKLLQWPLLQSVGHLDIGCFILVDNVTLPPVRSVCLVCRHPIDGEIQLNLDSRTMGRIEVRGQMIVAGIILWKSGDALVLVRICYEHKKEWSERQLCNRCWENP
jgi:hypothetical protein